MSCFGCVYHVTYFLPHLLCQFVPWLLLAARFTCFLLKFEMICRLHNNFRQVSFLSEIIHLNFKLMLEMQLHFHILWHCFYVAQISFYHKTFSIWIKCARWKLRNGLIYDKIGKWETWHKKCKWEIGKINTTSVCRRQLKNEHICWISSKWQPLY